MVLPFYNEKTLLDLLLHRLTETLPNVPIILATTTAKPDDNLAAIAKKYNVAVYRGSEENVLSRFIEAAEENNIDRVIRVCADNPLLDANSIERMIQDSTTRDVDYWCFSTSERLPTIKTGYGFWAEAVTLEALKKVSQLTTEKLYLEHVTNYIYTHPEQFTIHFEPIDKALEGKYDIRLTVDTESDFKLMQEIYRTAIEEEIPLHPKSLMQRIESAPQWRAIMKQEMQANLK
jgi:spore coat polysaccharide biosynthesis protein SpsF